MNRFVKGLAWQAVLGLLKGLSVCLLIRLPLILASFSQSLRRTKHAEDQGCS